MIKLQVRMASRGDLTSDMQPFVFGLGTPHELEAQLQDISQYQTIMNDHLAPSLSDVQNLLVPKAPSFPSKIIQARDMLMKTRIFITPFLGPDHVLVNDLNHFTALLRENGSFNENAVVPTISIKSTSEYHKIG